MDPLVHKAPVLHMMKRQVDFLVHKTPVLHMMNRQVDPLVHKTPVLHNMMNIQVDHICFVKLSGRD